MHYAPSAIVQSSNQSHASKLIIGQRMPPQVFVRPADGKPCEIQDLLPADTRFKILVFAGNTLDNAQMAKVKALAEKFDRPDNFYKRHGDSSPSKVFDVLTISSAKKDEVIFTDLPPVLRSHWSKYVVVHLSLPVGDL